MIGELAMVAIVIAALAALISTVAMKRLDESSGGTRLKETGPVGEAVALSPDGKTLASCAGTNALRLWRLNGPDEQRELDPLVLPPVSVPFAVAFSPDGTLLVAAGHQCLAVWRREQGRYLPLIQKGAERNRCLAISPSGRALAVGNDAGTVAIFGLPDAREQLVVRAHHSAVRSVAFSPDERRFVTSGEDRQVLLWDARSGELLRQLSHPGRNPVQFVAFAPDGRSIAVGELTPNAEDVVLIDPESGVVRLRLSGQETGTSALAFSPDSRILASAGLDRCVKLWDVKSGKEETTITDGVGRVESLTFSRDGSLLAFAGSDHSVRVWDVNRLRWSYVVERTPVKT
jgi:WD40 repeat protein